VTSAAFVCDECGHRTGKWMGFCTQCRERGSLRPSQPRPMDSAVISMSAIGDESFDRLLTGVPELDRTLGGGLVPGSAIVLGGEPGVGKSTLLLQVAGSIASRGHSALIVSAEESPSQVGLRASRLEGSFSAVDVLATTDVDEAVAIASSHGASIVMVDSIQALITRDVDGVPGSVSQVRECGARLVALAKMSGIPVVMIGHVTKEGTLAGPRVLEHMVDVVLHFEGDPHRGLRFLRGVKNRFGPTPALGLFEMGSSGLSQIEDLAALRADSGGEAEPGVVMFPAIEGRRPLVVEVQALTSPSAGGTPRRSVNGIEAARLHQILAVLERHASLKLSDCDVYVAVAAGVRLKEPAVDLAVALAVASSASGVALPDTAAWGEVGLTGRIRSVTGQDIRTAESARLGVQHFVSPGDGTRRLVDALAAVGIRSAPADSGSDLSQGKQHVNSEETRKAS
jgi:DNA repair protein RadA/Sms